MASTQETETRFVSHSAGEEEGGGEETLPQSLKTTHPETSRSPFSPQERQADEHLAGRDQ